MEKTEKSKAQKFYESIVRMANKNPQDDILEAVRNNINQHGFFWLLNCARIDEDDKLPTFYKHRSFSIKLLWLGKNHWIKLFKNVKMIVFKKGEAKPTTTSQSLYRTDMKMFYKNRFHNYDLVLVNHYFFQESIHELNRMGKNGGWESFRKYLYALHHEVFHSLEGYIYLTQKTKVNLILPSKSGKHEYDDCVLLGLVKDFPTKAYFDVWLRKFP